MSFQLSIRYPNGQVVNFPFEKDEVYCGRAQGNDIRLAHGFVSTRHFRIWQRNGRFFVEDVGSTNGTLLNGQALEAHVPQVMGPDDVIQVGSLEVRLDPIVDATVIERVSRPLPVGEPHVPPTARPRVEAPDDDAPAPMWQLQTGMIRQQKTGIRIDDQSVSIPRREMVGGFQQPGLEERIARRRPQPAAPRSTSSFTLDWGTLSQILGAALLLTALGVLAVVLFA
ncbi:MAG TPA: FHA domain-containing protein [Thermoanaerobaculia bacterium]|nr:FHA domain-containing protein [Thermoanaerobaculia bacterium]